VLCSAMSYACSKLHVCAAIGPFHVRCPYLLITTLSLSFLQRNNLLALKEKTKIPLVQLLDEWDVVSAILPLVLGVDGSDSLLGLLTGIHIPQSSPRLLGI
jgi:hypothetical protein